MGKFYITTPIYYVNDKPHIGHAYTTIAADVLARFHRMLGDKVFFLTGTDEYAQKTVQAAAKLKKDTQQYSDEMAVIWRKTWEKLELSNTDFIRTTEERHKKAVYKFFEKVNARGDIYKGKYEGFYCVGHEAFMKEADLVDGICPEHKTKPEWITEENYFFRLSKYQEQLLDHYVEHPEFIRPQSRYNEAVSFVKQGLEDISISRSTQKWGIPFPTDPKHVFYVWFDALINYLSGIGYGTDDKMNDWWPADIQLVGKDIIRFHCVIWPAMLLSAGLELPRTVFAHGFFTINGEKISKTVGNVIDPVAMAEKYGNDTLRYFLLREIPFGEDGDFSETKLAQRYESDLANGLGNLLSRVTNLIEKELDGLLPDTPDSPHDLTDVYELTQSLRFHDALQKIWRAIAWANQYIDETKLWEQPKKDPKLFGEAITSLTALLQDIARKLAPYMPETAEKIRLALSAEKITKSAPLFPRLP